MADRQHSIKILGCGTSTGVPLPGCECKVCLSDNEKNKRTRTSSIIGTAEGRNILIDASPDLRFQALKFGIKRIDAVLFTHAHMDHILGIDDLRPFNFIQKSSIPCYGSSKTLSEIKKVFSYIFNPDPLYEGGWVPRLDLNNLVDLQSFSVPEINFQITPFTVMHGHMPVTAYRAGELAYVTDCNLIPDPSMKVIRGSKYLILDGLRYEPHRTHFTIPQAIEVAREVGAERTILIHTTHNVEYEEVNNQLPEGVELAYDGLELTFRA